MFLQLGPANQVFFRLGLALHPARAIRGQLNQAGFQIFTGFLAVANIGFNRRHFGIDTEKCTLRRLHRIIGGVIGFAQGLQLGFDIALTGNGFFQLNLCRRQAGRQ